MMKIESVKIVNYKIFQNAEINDIPEMAVFIGKNGSGKTTLFDVFGFIRDCLNGNVNTALMKRGGYEEVVSRDHFGEDISFVIECRPAGNEHLMTYELSLGLNENKRPVVKKEVLSLRRGENGASWKALEFAGGEGFAAAGDLNSGLDTRLTERKQQKLDAPDILALKGLGQFKDYAAVAAFRKLVESWYVSDFRAEAARGRQEAGYCDQLSRNGDNLAVVAKYIYDNHPGVFNEIMQKMQMRIPGVEKVEAQETQDGYVVLRFQEGRFKNPFSARYVSDGTIRMFSYLLLLHDPHKHALLCAEEPENQLYPELLPELAEEFQIYADADSQVFVSTHSPDFLNAVPLESIYCLIKQDGYTVIKRAGDNPLAQSLYDAGDLPGTLWRQDLLAGGLAEGKSGK